jgi:hypothetical protein
MKLEKIVKSKFLYYVALALMAVNVLGYISLGSMECILVFGVAYYASHFVTKNRTLDIFLALFVANIVFGCGRIKEGYEGLDTKAGKLASECDHKAQSECSDAATCKWDATRKKCLHKAAQAATESLKSINKAKAVKTNKKAKGGKAKPRLPPPPKK